MVFESILFKLEGILALFNQVQLKFPWFPIFIFSLVIFIYALFVWKFYHFVSERDMIHLKLEGYLTSKTPFSKKVIAAISFLIIYLIITPFIVLLWFSIFSVFLLILSEKLDVQTILLVSGAVISAVRISAYYKQGLAKDLAKLFPFTLLAVLL